MIECSRIQLIRDDGTDREFSYRGRKAAEGGYIVLIFGRDRKAQRHFHDKAWQGQSPDIATHDGQLIGTIATIEGPDSALR